MSSTKKTADVIALLLLLTLLVTAFLARSPYSVPVPIRDSGIFLSIGSDILHGKILYQQTWDNKQPFLYLINAAGLWLGHGSVWGVWGLELALLILVFFLSYRVIRPALSPWHSFAVIAVAFLAVFPFMGGNYSEEYSLVGQAGILGLLFGVYLPDRRRFSRPLAALAMGALVGFVFCIKQTYLDIPVTVALFLVFLAWIEQDHRLVKHLLWMGAGFVLVNLPVFIYFQVHGALRDYILNAFLFNRYYSYLLVPGRIASLIEMISFVTSHPFFCMAASVWLGIVILLVTRIRPGSIKRYTLDLARGYLVRQDWKTAGPPALLFLGMVNFPIFFLTISLSGKLWTHYYIPFFPGLILLLAGSLSLLYRHIAVPAKRTALNCLLAAVLLTGAFPPLNQVVGALAHPAGGDARSAAAAYLKSATTSDQSILVWGWESGIYFMAQRQSPTRFGLPFALYVKTPYQDEFAATALQEVQVRPPAFIADLRDPLMPFIDGRPAATCVSGNQMNTQAMVDFLAYVCANYEEDRSFETINIYRLKAKP